MPEADAALTAHVAAVPPARVEADLLVQPVFEEGGESAGLTADGVLARATGQEVARALASGEFRGKAFELFLAPIADTAWTPRRVLLVGLGPRREWSATRMRRAATTAALAARQRRYQRLGLVLPIGLEGADGLHAVQALVEGVLLAAFDAGRYKTDDDAPGELRGLEVVVPADTAGPAVEHAQAAADRGRILGESCNLTRGLANEPGNSLTPRVLAERAQAIATGTSLAVDVLEEGRIAELQMGLLLGVSRGSVEPPRVIVLRHEPDGASGPVLGLVGKGITFDTGGISIKPAEAMDRMKDDMAGGGAVVGAMRAISLLGAPIRVVGVVPTAENMPGGRALKPGDVLRSASGKTVEVLNTDAEGRLILGDALWYARQLGATHVVDVATLTGACMVALGRTTSGLFGTPEAWVDVVRQAADRAGDRAWPMPTYADYREQLRSEVADLANVGGRPAGAITAAVFLREFVGDTPWAHLDIAGTAWAEDVKPYQPRGATGVAVRTLAELAWTSGRWPL